MKAAKKRKSHLPEFKAKVGLAALKGMKTVSTSWNALRFPDA